MYNTDQVEYMAYPRALALAEVAWSPKSARDFESFRRRLLPRLLGLDRIGVNYRFPSADNGLERNRAVTGDSVVGRAAQRASGGGDPLHARRQRSDGGLRALHCAAPPRGAGGRRVGARADVLRDARRAPIRAATFRAQSGTVAARPERSGGRAGLG